MYSGLVNAGCMESVTSANFPPRELWYVYTHELTASIEAVSSRLTHTQGGPDDVF